jgi:DNA-binding CsgD family transcriptional regulator
MSSFPVSVAAIFAQLTPLFAPGLDPTSFQKRAAALLRATTGSPVVTFARLHVATRRLEVDFDPLIPGLTAGLPGFGRHMASYPCFNFDPSVNQGRPFLRADFMSDAEFYASPIYREGFALAGITDHATMLVHADQDLVFFIGLERLGGVFRPEQRELLVLLQPHLINAYLLARDFASLGQAIADPQAFIRAGLSARQAEVLALLASGKSNAEIGTLLALRLSTVKSYVQAVFNKLGVDNRHAAILRAHHLARLRSEPAPQSGRLSTHARRLAG